MAPFFVAKSLKVIEIGGRTFVLHFDSVEDWIIYESQQGFCPSVVDLKFKFPSLYSPKTIRNLELIYNIFIATENLFSRTN